MNNKRNINILPKKDIPKLMIYIFMIFLLVLVPHLFYGNLKHHTIGIITGYSRDANGYKYANYEYTINQIVYENSNSYEIRRFRKPNIGERYYVSFFYYMPSESIIHFDKPVIEDSIIVPVMGWVGDIDSLFLKYSNLYIPN